MPNRILKESIRTSDSIDKLSWFEEVLFYRLIVSCDDFGRFDGRPAIVKNMLFPLKDNLTLQTVSKAINNLASAELVVLYVFEGKPYLYLPGWNEHQIVRAKKSRYPEPDSSMITSEIICKQENANVSVIQSNPIQSESNPNPIRESESNPPNPPRGDFDRFWAAYPKKVGKDAALRAFKKTKVPVETMIQAIEAQKQSDQWQKSGGQFIPNPATWLNQGRWEDEVNPLVNPPAIQNRKAQSVPADYGMAGTTVDTGDIDWLLREGLV